MPVGLVQGDRRLLVGGAIVLVLIVVMTVVMAQGMGSDAEIPITTSAASGGAKAASLLLEASGYEVARWQRPPGELTDPGRTTLVLADPRDLPTKAERQAIEAFITRGGRVVATGLVGSYFLSNGAMEDPAGQLAWTPVPAIAPSAVTRAAPTITLAPQARWRSEDLFLPLYGDEGAAVVVRLSIGTGDAYWWAAATPLTNAGLREPGNLEFFLAQLGAPGERRVLFDEYFYGARPTLAGSIIGSPVKWILVQGAIILFALLATYSRRSGPIMLPAIESRLSPLEFVRTLGSLYGRAGATAVAVDVAYRRFRFWLGRRLGMPGTASIDVVSTAAAARWPVEAASLAATLRHCEEARDRGDLSAKTALSLVRARGDHAATLRLYPAKVVGGSEPRTFRRSEHTKETR